MKLLIGLFCAAVLLVAPTHAATTTLAIDAIDDPEPYLLVGSGVTGTVKFSLAQISEPIVEAQLTVNPYGLPLGLPTMEVFGFESDSGPIIPGEPPGSFLGTWTLPANLGFGQDASFDVTEFLRNVDSEVVGFSLTGGASLNIFSTIEFNYGHPSQLRVTTIPEPSAGSLASVGLLCCGLAPFSRSPRRT